jgi:GTPase SAR1 family protein
MFRRGGKKQKEYTSNGGEKYGLIILGNSGVGKSFLANVLVGHEAFAHAFSSSAVTHETEFIEVHIGGLPLAIFNIPGLIEAEQERINLNKVEIDKAFSQRPNSVILFVFGHQNGRVRDEDVVAFNAINAAYPFRPESLVIVVNALPKDRPKDYEGSTFVLLQKLLPNTKVTNDNVCFLDSINVNDAREKQYLKEQLLKVRITTARKIEQQSFFIIVSESFFW